MTDLSTVHYHYHSADSKDVFGFWIYIMSDCILFASLFATYAVLHNHTYGGPGMRDIIDFPYIFMETLCLLISSFTYGLAILSMYRNNKNHVVLWLIITFLFGAAFVSMEVNEFVHLVIAGHSWHSSAFFTAFFTLVGTHGLHVTIGLIWMLCMVVKLLLSADISTATSKKLTYLGLFWSFLDIVWIFVFTIVYLMGAI
jgi:cytochrome o ubiquinol oxidase subunit 3